MNPSIQLPEQRSTFAPMVDDLYMFIFYVSVIFFVGIVGAMMYFAWKYRRREGVSSRPPGHATLLELFWTFSPLLLLAIMFHWGFNAYIYSAKAPTDSIKIRVTAKQWAWGFEHPNGTPEIGSLTVPVNVPVQLIIGSEDVLHSFYVPEFRIKKDAVPGMWTTVWFQATKLGETQVFCTEYCGAPKNSKGNAGHSAMLAKINVVPMVEYKRLLKEGPQNPFGDTPAASAQWGESIFNTNCKSCHVNAAGAVGSAPNFWGLYGRQEKLTTGETVTVDDAYILNSIRAPQSQIVSGYENINMSAFKLPARQEQAVIDYIKTLK